MGDSDAVEKAFDACFNPLKMVYLLRIVFGFHDYYFCFHTLETLDTFVKMFRTTFVNSISDYNYIKMEMELLTKEEYEKRINKEEE